MFKTLSLMVLQDMSYGEIIRNRLVEELLDQATLYNLGLARNKAKKRDKKERTKKKRIEAEGETINPNAGN